MGYQGAVFHTEEEEGDDNDADVDRLHSLLVVSLYVY